MALVLYNGRLDNGENDPDADRMEDDAIAMGRQRDAMARQGGGGVRRKRDDDAVDRAPASLRNQLRSEQSGESTAKKQAIDPESKSERQKDLENPANNERALQPEGAEYIERVVGRTIDATEIFEANGQHTAWKQGKDLEVEEKAQPAASVNKLRLVDVVDETAQPAPGKPTVKVYLWDENTFVVRGKQKFNDLTKGLAVPELSNEWKKHPNDAVMDRVTNLLNANFKPPVAVAGLSSVTALSHVMAAVSTTLNTQRRELESANDTIKTRNEEILSLKAQLAASNDAVKAAAAKSAKLNKKATRDAIEKEVKARVAEFDRAAKQYVEKADQSVKELRESVVEKTKEAAESKSQMKGIRDRLANTVRFMGVTAKPEATVQELCLSIDKFADAARMPFKALSASDAVKHKTDLSLTLVSYFANKSDADPKEMSAPDLVNTLSGCAPALKTFMEENKNLLEASLTLAKESDASLAHRIGVEFATPRTRTESMRVASHMCIELDKNLAAVTGHVPGDGTTHLDILNKVVKFFGMNDPNVTAATVVARGSAAFGDSFATWYSGVYHNLVRAVVNLCPLDEAKRFAELPVEQRLTLSTVNNVLRNTSDCITALKGRGVPIVIKNHDILTEDAEKMKQMVQRSQASQRSAEAKIQEITTNSTAAIQTLQTERKTLTDCLEKVANLPPVLEKLRTENKEINADTLPPAVEAVTQDLKDVTQTVSTLTEQKNILNRRIQEDAINAIEAERVLAEERRAVNAVKDQVRVLKLQFDAAVRTNQELQQKVSEVAKPKDAPMPEVAQPVLEVAVEYKLEDPAEERLWQTLQPKQQLWFVIAKNKTKPKGWSKKDRLALAHWMRLDPEVLDSVLAQAKAVARRNVLAEGGGGPPDGDPRGGRSATFGDVDPDPDYDGYSFPLKLPVLPYARTSGSPDDPPPGRNAAFGMTRPRKIKDPEMERMYAAGAPPPPPPPPGGGASVDVEPKKKKTPGKQASFGKGDDDGDGGPIKYPSKPDVKDPVSDLLWRVQYLQTLLAKERTMVRQVVSRLHRVVSNVLSLMAYACPATDLTVPSYNHAMLIYGAVHEAWPDVPEPDSTVFPGPARAKLDDTWAPRKPVGDATALAQPGGDRTDEPDTKGLLDTWGVAKVTKEQQITSAVTARRKTIMDTVERNAKTMANYEAYVDGVLQNCIDAKGVDWCSLLSIVEADRVNAEAVVTAVVRNINSAAEETQKLRLSVTAAHENMLQQAQTVARFGGYYVTKLTQEVMGAQELDFEKQMEVSKRTLDLTAMLRQPETAPSELREEVLQLTARLLGALSLGRHECHGVLMKAYAQGLASKKLSPPMATALVLTPENIDIILARAPPSVATKLLHWGATHPEAAKWATNLNRWAMQEITAFMSLPQDLFPSVIELMHTRMANAYSSPMGLSLQLMDGRRDFCTAVSNSVFTDCPLLAVTGGFSVLELQTERYPFPFDRHTLLVTGLPTLNAACVMLQQKMEACKNVSFVSDARVELVFVNAAGNVVRPPDAGTGPVSFNIQRNDNTTLKVSVAMSDATNHAEYLVRLRWVRVTRLLREFDALSKQGIAQARAVLVRVLNASHTADTLLDLPVLEVPVARRNAHGSGAYLGQPADQVNLQELEVALQHDEQVAAERGQVRAARMQGLS